MTQYPPMLGHARISAMFQKVQSRLALLESRTSGIDSGMPLGLLPGVISATYTAGDPQAYVNGAVTLTGPYKYVASYTPAAGDTVILAPVGGTLKQYVVIGRLQG